jgi:hypothetical protein
MTQTLTTHESFPDFIRRLDDLAAGCDPDFDTAFDDLDREFAELRLTFGE